jgi:hypothetical protein
VTLTPGRTAPCASVTTPVRRPCELCAYPGDDQITATIVAAKSHTDLNLIRPPHKEPMKIAWRFEKRWRIVSTRRRM